MPFQAPASDLSTDGGGFAAPDDEIVKEHSLSGFGENLATDVKDNAKGLWNLAGNFVQHPIDTAVDTIKHTPEALINEGKRLGIGTLLEGHPIDAMKQFGQAAYDKPLTTGMEVIPAAAGIAKGFGAASEAARGAEVAADAAGAARAGTATSAAEDAARAGVAGGAGASAEELVPMEGATGVSGRSAIGGLPEMAAPEEAAASQIAAPAEDAVAGLVKKGSGMVDDAAGKMNEVKSYIANKYGQASANPKWPEKVAKYLKNEVSDFRGKDIGLQGNQVRQMGEGFKGVEKAEALMDYASEKGYFKPGLSDLSRKEQIIKNMDKAGETVGAIRDIVGKRGKPPLELMYNNVEAELLKKYGIKAPGQVDEVLAIIKQKMKEDPTFSGVADIATDLNKELRNVRSMGRHVGPNTDAADSLSRMNNEAIRRLLNSKEAEAYTESLRDFGAHKKLEKAAAGAARRKMTGRSNQRGPLGRLWQEALDRGGYRVMGNVADRAANVIMKDPSKVKNLPQFFEELVHQAEDVLDESLDIQGGAMAEGGIIGDLELNDFLESKYGNKKERQ